jgi:hypothetical protein
MNQRQTDMEMVLNQIESYREELKIGVELPCPYLVCELDRVRRYSKELDEHEYFENWFAKLSWVQGNDDGKCVIATEEVVNQIKTVLDKVEQVALKFW